MCNLLKGPLPMYTLEAKGICLGINLEGLIISGLSKRGFALMQAYADLRSADIQVAALVSLYARLLNRYRNRSNTWQMWSSLAMFAVGRQELHHGLKVNANRHSAVDAAFLHTIVNTEARFRLWT